MFVAIAMGAMAVVAFLVTACRLISLRRLLGFGTALDVGFSLLIFAAFQGTLTGLLIATVSGLFMALTVTLLRRAIGYETLHFMRVGLRIYPIWTPHQRKRILPKIRTRRGRQDTNQPQRKEPRVTA